MKQTLALIAIVPAILGNVPYLWSVLKRKVQPHPYTWLVWSLVSAITFFGQLAKGAGVGVIPTGAAEIFTIIIFLFSLRYGFRNIIKRDTYFFIIALLGIIPWILTKDPTISVVIAVSIDLTAFIPTIRKTWNFPKTESPTLYSMNVLRHILTLFSLQTYNIATMLHSMAMIITNTIMTGIIFGRGKGKARGV
jgi:hypothetical protein